MIEWPKGEVVRVAVALAIMANLFLVPLTGHGEDQAPPDTTGKADPTASEKKPTAAPEYVGSGSCKNCHKGHSKDWKVNPHRNISEMANRSLARDCESCHGPASLHLEAGGGATGIINPLKTSGQAINSMCLSCHAQGSLMEAKGSLHLTHESNCLTCHAIHNNHQERLLKKPQTQLCQDCHALQVAETKLFSRHPIREGHMQCSQCHNPHGAKEKMLIRNTVNQLCTKCHNQQVGPFTFDHPPVSESCLTCHKAHGSQIRGLLEARVPVLCLRCHGNTSFTHDQSQPNKHKCLDCHESIHGSNFESRFFR